MALPIIYAEADMNKEERQRNLELMESGKVYDPGDMAIMVKQEIYKLRVNRYNRTSGLLAKRRMKMLKKIFADCGNNAYVEPPFRANFGGRHVHVGDDFYANFNLVLVDDAHIYIGDRCMFGPNVTIVTASHPVAPEKRGGGYQFNKDVRIGDDVWLCAGVTVIPGVTIGDGSVIAAGAVVTTDIPSGVVAAGVPAKVVKEIGDRDREYFYKNERF